MEQYFNINYEFDKKVIDDSIDEQLRTGRSDYICVADGVILNIANRSSAYLDVINGGMFAICDSGYVPIYIKWLYGRRYEQYTGSMIFEHLIRTRKYRMFFMGASQQILDGLKENLKQMNPDVADMTFYELPFRKVENFDYQGIARMIEADSADIIWVALGAPKQEIFMSLLKPHLKRGVMIAVGAAFKFFSGGVDANRAPQWMIDHHLEFVHRILVEPKKQLKRCGWIVMTLPRLLWEERQRMKRKKRNLDL